MRQVNRLSSNFVRQKSLKPGKYPDGNNLYLVVSSETARSWVFRFSLRGAEHERGLGSAWDVDLADARQKVVELRRLLSKGIDPTKLLHPDKIPTFEEVLADYVRVFGSRWSNKKSPHQWLKTADYVGLLAKMPVDQIKTSDVKVALVRMWSRIPEVASRTRGRIEAILDYAKHQGYREGDNPARWKGCLEYVLPPIRKEEHHHRALPYAEVASFYQSLGERIAESSLAYRFCILTCARTEEVRLARWEEIDLEKHIWSLGKFRMKGRRPYRVPLSAEAVKLLKAIGPKPEGFIFERAPGKPFSNNALLVLRNRMGFKERCTTHGFRSSFREWAQSNNVDRTVAEMCLDHKVFSKTEAAYMRADLLEERREVLEVWASYVTVPTIAETVVEFKRGQK